MELLRLPLLLLLEGTPPPRPIDELLLMLLLRWLRVLLGARVLR